MIPLEKIKKSLIANLSEAEVVDGLKLISNTFNLNRTKIDDVYKSASNVSSYACFYLPTNMYKMKFLLSQIDQSLIEDIRKSSVIDIGCGPGTYTFSLIECLNEPLMSFYGIDHNPLMLEQAKKLHDAIYPCSSIDWRQDIPKVDGAKTMIFGNSINEMGYKEALRLIHRVEPEIIVAIEPGTKESYTTMNELRTQLIKAGFHINFPCPGDGECPMKQDNWCHQIIRTQLDFDVERLSQLIERDRKTMPAVIHLYSKRKLFHQNSLIRLEKNQKHAYLWNICQSESVEKNSFKKIEILKRSFSKSDKKNLEKISTGHSLVFDVEKEISENISRVKLLKTPKE